MWQYGIDWMKVNYDVKNSRSLNTWQTSDPWTRQSPDPWTRDKLQIPGHVTNFRSLDTWQTSDPWTCDKLQIPGRVTNFRFLDTWQTSDPWTRDKLQIPGHVTNFRYLETWQTSDPWTRTNFRSLDTWTNSRSFMLVYHHIWNHSHQLLPSSLHIGSFIPLKLPFFVSKMIFFLQSINKKFQPWYFSICLQLLIRLIIKFSCPGYPLFMVSPTRHWI